MHITVPAEISDKVREFAREKVGPTEPQFVTITPEKGAHPPTARQCSKESR